MTDIVERLRLQNDCLLGTGHDFSDVLLDAADEIERLRDEADEDDAALAAAGHLADKQQTEIKRLRDALKFVLDFASWHFDGDADPANESPEDMTAHINGLIVQRVRETLDHESGDKYGI